MTSSSSSFVQAGSISGPETTAQPCAARCRRLRIAAAQAISAAWLSRRSQHRFRICLTSASSRCSRPPLMRASIWTRNFSRSCMRGAHSSVCRCSKVRPQQKTSGTAGSLAPDPPPIVAGFLHKSKGVRALRAKQPLSEVVRIWGAARELFEDGGEQRGGELRAARRVRSAHDDRRIRCGACRCR